MKRTNEAVATYTKGVETLGERDDKLAIQRTGPRAKTMNETAQFVSDLNIARFLDKLRLEHDPATRTVLQRLLIEEEDRFGGSVERLSTVQRHIAEGNRRISLQKALVAKLAANGEDIGPAEMTLSNLVEIQRIFEQYRQVILDTIDRNGTIPLHELTDQYP
jgi:hypothetical protein